LLTGNHLCHNPRVLKAAGTLARNGLSVEVLGAWSDPALKARDEELLPEMPFKFIPVADLTVSKASQMRQRLRKKAGHVAHQFAKFDNRWQLGACYPELRATAFHRQADLYIAHSEQAMAAAVDLLREGRRVGIDMEDWFSEDLSADARRHRPLRLLRDLERKLLTRGALALCPSSAMSAALASENDCRPPAVVYNAFAWSERRRLDGERRDRRDSSRRSIHWYSQTLGPGRGLEDLVAALPLLNVEAEIHLRGQPAAGFADWLQARTPAGWKRRVFFHGLVGNDELLSRVAEHDIGFAGELDDCRSRDLTVTNKILHYLLAGLAVVASDTTGQREVAHQSPGAVLLYPSGDFAALGRQLTWLLESCERLRNAKAAALHAAEQTFCWERQESALSKAVLCALGEQAT
jgi:glycosyltransferase involved in cell wall biosynthesis